MGSSRKRLFRHIIRMAREVGSTLGNLTAAVQHRTLLGMMGDHQFSPRKRAWLRATVAAQTAKPPNCKRTAWRRTLLARGTAKTIELERKTAQRIQSTYKLHKALSDQLLMVSWMEIPPCEVCKSEIIDPLDVIMSL